MVIIAAVLMLFLIFKPFGSLQPQTSVQTSTTTTIQAVTLDRTADKIETAISAISNTGFEFVEVKQEKEYDASYENGNYKIVFDPKNAVIRNAYIKHNNNNIDLVQGTDEFGSLELKLGSWNNDITLKKLTGGKSYYTFVRENNKFIFTCKFKNLADNNIFTVIKTFTFFDNENVFKMNINISNAGNKIVLFDNSNQAFSIGMGPLMGLNSRNKRYNQVNDTYAYFKGKNVKKIPLNDGLVKKANNFYTIAQEGNDTWIANHQYFFASILQPDNNRYKYFFDYRDGKDLNYYCGLSRDTVELSNIKSDFFIYIGPKQEAILTKYNNPEKNSAGMKDAKFEMINDYFGNHALTWFIENTIGNLINWIAQVVKNYGLAIIIITFIIKLLLSPLTHKSMISQEKMKGLQPKLKEIQTKYKDKPEELNKETMALYKREGVNPFAGCLPLLLQMPILTAMYYLLANLYSLNGASFLWIKDLAMPDAVWYFPGDFIIPFVNINSLNIMPIIMTLVSVFSSFTTPDMSSNKQAQMMMWMMPLLFFFLFYNVASGLVLYWTIMNILNLAQQVYINYFRKKIVKAKK
jgi:YidC/Oxa1 family membrane protein insertase